MDDPGDDTSEREPSHRLEVLAATQPGNCVSCGGDLDYSDKHDAHRCRGCDQWAEAKCPDPECEFCVGRPDRRESLRDDG